MTEREQAYLISDSRGRLLEQGLADYRARVERAEEGLQAAKTELSEAERALRLLEDRIAEYHELRGEEA